MNPLHYTYHNKNLKIIRSPSVAFHHYNGGRRDKYALLHGQITSINSRLLANLGYSYRT